MPKNEVKRDYNFPDGHLKQSADNMANLLERDSDAFADRGVNETKIAEFTEARAAFESYPSDEQLDGIKVSSTETKDRARATLETPMRSILLMARNVFGEGSGKYKEFGNSDLTRQSDDEIVRTAKLMIGAATKYLPELKTEGLTAEKITILTDNRTELDIAIDEQLIAINERDTTTQERIENGNRLYALLAKYAETGKDLWYRTNEAKYNDYIIYNTESGGPEGQPPVA